jgi:hypothetical protein
MTSLRDSDLNAALRGTSAYTDPNAAPATEGTGEAGHAGPVVTDAVRVRNEDEARSRTRDTRERAFENAYAQKLEEAPGFGAHETPDAKGLKAAMASVGLPPVQPGAVAQVNAKVANNPEFKQLVADMAGVLQAGPQGAQAIPSPGAWAKRLNTVAASAGLGALGSTAAAGQGGGQRASVGAGEGAGAAGTPAPSAEGQTPVQYDAGLRGRQAHGCHGGLEALGVRRLVGAEARRLLELLRVGVLEGALPGIAGARTGLIIVADALGVGDHGAWVAGLAGALGRGRAVGVRVGGSAPQGGIEVAVAKAGHGRSRQKSMGQLVRTRNGVARAKASRINRTRHVSFCDASTAPVFPYP